MSENPYLFTESLLRAVDMAKMLGMPLLLTGEPGVGKSSLARAVAEQDDLPCFEMRVHSDTRYRDLFYHFDDIGRFSEANLPHTDLPHSDIEPGSLSPADARHFIRFEGLGAAILQASNRDAGWLQPALQQNRFQAGKTGSVVLIDEIDKAPRDVPNDLLVELERWTFRIPEFSRVNGYPANGISLAKDDPQPLVIITSNGEKPLPEAFLRRCVYFDITIPQSREQSPEADVTLDDIVAAYVAAKVADNPNTSQLQQEAVAGFAEIRALAQQRKPGLAELLNWLHYLAKHENTPDSIMKLSVSEVRESLCALLLKNVADHKTLGGEIDPGKYPIVSRWLTP